MTVGPTAIKACGDCTLCCKVMAIEQLAKPAGSWCPHCKPGRGCLVYADRPAECQNFSCLWRVDDRLDQRWKPGKSKFVLTTSEDGIEIRCDPGFPDDLGLVGSDERIVRELEGTHVVAATAVKVPDLESGN